MHTQEGLRIELIVYFQGVGGDRQDQLKSFGHLVVNNLLVLCV